MNRCLSISLVGLTLLCSANRFSFAQSSDAGVPSKTTIQGSQARPLTNSDVIALTKAGVSPAVIVEEIRSSASSFDTSPEALIKLKGSGVAEEALLAMLNKSAKSGADTGALTSTGNITGKISELELDANDEFTVFPDVGMSVWLFPAGSFCPTLRNPKTQDGRSATKEQIEETSEGVRIYGNVAPIKQSFFHRSEPAVFLNFLKPIVEATTADDGSYAMENLRSGGYDFAVQENVDFSYSPLTHQISGGGGGGVFCQTVEIATGERKVISGVLNDGNWKTCGDDFFGGC